ncbi:hypothetical protein Tsubulata_022407 [Turnera subulata]|uniref:Secreted protein n=1 Tax=Turnera subulata TaxID=218843 RepID=A0A9Q0FFF8_9ROSI|nr:hypothetical protein Tsubulata_022407 [Turnera subulata]
MHHHLLCSSFSFSLLYSFWQAICLAPQGLERQGPRDMFQSPVDLTCRIRMVVGFVLSNCGCCSCGFLKGRCLRIFCYGIELCLWIVWSWRAPELRPTPPASSHVWWYLVLASKAWWLWCLWI